MTILPSSFLKDKTRFSNQIKKNPKFLLRHLPFLITLLVSKGKNFLKIKFRAPHFGTKVKATFIDAELDSLKIDNHYNSSDLCLVDYDIHTPEKLALNGAPHKGFMVESKSEGDFEHYFMLNRWGWLFDEGLKGKRGMFDYRKEILNWLDRHKDKEHDSAWETYSTCERVVNLLVYLSVCSEGSISDIKLKPLNDFIYESLEWIHTHLEYYGDKRTNNHFLNNARALIVGGVALGCRKYIISGISIFRKYLPEMILKNGMLRERSSHYQLIVLTWILDALSFLSSYSEREVDDIKFLTEFVSKMADSASILCDEKGNLLALIGDVSPDNSPERTSMKLSTLYPNYWPRCNQSKTNSQYIDGWFKLSNLQETVIGNFPKGEYPLSYPTHGHSDFTGFCWIKDGESLLSDSGRFRYTPDEISNVQKSSVGHCVPLVDGYAPLSESVFPPSEYFPKPYSHAWLCLELESQKLVLSHNGFYRSTPVTKHSRTISIKNHELEVIDAFDGSGDVIIDLLWHFGNQFTSFERNSCSVKSLKQVINLSFCHSSSNKNASNAMISTCALYFSPLYGKKENSLGVSVRFKESLPISIKTYFRLEDICVE